MKSKTSRILFWCSFLPYLIVLILAIASGIDGAINGYTFLFGPAIYGTKAFWNSFIFALLVFGFIIPVIPLCIYCHICYFFRTCIYRLQRIPLSVYILCCSIIPCLVIAYYIRLWF